MLELLSRGTYWLSVRVQNSWEPYEDSGIPVGLGAEDARAPADDKLHAKYRLI